MDLNGANINGGRRLENEGKYESSVLVIRACVCCRDDVCVVAETKARRTELFLTSRSAFFSFFLTSGDLRKHGERQEEEEEKEV